MWRQVEHLGPAPKGLRAHLDLCLNPMNYAMNCGLPLLSRPQVPERGDMRPRVLADGSVIMWDRGMIHHGREKEFLVDQSAR